MKGSLQAIQQWSLMKRTLFYIALLTFFDLQLFVPDPAWRKSARMDGTDRHYDAAPQLGLDFRGRGTTRFASEEDAGRYRIGVLGEAKSGARLRSQKKAGKRVPSMN